MDGGNAAKYWAFISYSHQDKRLAHQLADRLAKEPVPKAARDRVEGAEKTFSSLFVDEREVAAGSHLGDRLERALDASHALIVICSPFSAASSYVAQEIAYFHRIGRADRIFCLIASGQPNATDAGTPHLECFPPPLRFQLEADGTLTDRSRAPEDRPLAASVGLETPKEWRKALDQLVSGMLGITQSDLERARSRRQLIKGALIAGASIAALAVVGVLYDGLFRPQTQYFENWARRDGVWTGIDPLSARDARQRNSTYAFRYNGSWSKRPHAVERVNGHGACHIDGMEGVLGRPFTEACSARRSCGVEFTYADGAITREELVDQTGVVVESLQFTGPAVGTFVEAQFPCTREAAGISYVQFERFDSGELRGFDREIRFLGEDRSPRPNTNRAYGFRYDRDSSGRVLSRTTLGPRGEAWRDADRVARIDYTRDEHGRVVEENYAATDGAPTFNDDGYAGVRRTFDIHGNVTATSYLDTERRPTANANSVSGTALRYGDRGQSVSLTYLDPRGQPRMLGVTEERYAHDTRGYVTEISFWDETGAAIPAWNGVHRWTTIRDNSGNPTEQRSWALDGTPTMGRNRYHMMAWTYNERGQYLTHRYFGLRDEPVLNDRQVHGYRRAYDESGRFIAEEATLGLDAQPIVAAGDSEEGAIERRQFDERGNVIEARYLDASGEPMLTHRGRHIVRQQFDDFGRLTNVAYFGVTGEPTTWNGVVHRSERLYDAQGNQSESRAFRVDGEGASGSRSVYDDRGLQIESVTLDASHQPTGNVTRRRYDERGREIEQAFVTTTGAPTGITTRHAFDEQGREVAVSYFTAAGEPTTQQGHHREERRYDERGSWINTRYFGPGGEPALKDGVHEWRVVRDRYNRMLEQRSFGVRGEPVPSEIGRTHHLIRYGYDDRGLQIEYRLFDAADQPTTDEHGVSLYRTEYDPRGLRIRSLRFDTAERPTPGRDGAWVAEWDYDQRGLVVAQRLLNAERQVFQPDRAGYGPRQSYAYDLFGRQIEHRNLTSEGELDPSGPRASYRTEYDAWSRVIRIRNFGADGQPINHRTQGWAVEESSYDPQTGDKTTIRYNTDGRRVS